MDLKSLIQNGVLQGRFLVSLHASRRLRQRKVPLWQIEAGVNEWVVIEERPDDLPNPSIVVEQMLQDGTTVTVVWAWDIDDNQPLLVTVFFPE
jgi:hypothetical protein